MFKDCLTDKEVFNFSVNKENITQEERIKILSHINTCNVCMRKITYMKKNEKNILRLTPKYTTTIESIVKPIVATVAVVSLFVLYNLLGFNKNLNQSYISPNQFTALEVVKEEMLFTAYLDDITKLNDTYEDKVLNEILPKEEIF